MILAALLQIAFYDDESETTAPVLNQTITTRSQFLGSMTAAYPETYVAYDDGEGTLYIATSQQLIDTIIANDESAAPALDPGQFGMMIFGFWAELMIAPSFDESASLGDNLMALVAGLAESGDGTAELGEVEETTFGDRDGVLVAATAMEDDTVYEVVYVLMQVEGGYVLLSAFSARDEMGDYDEVIRAIATNIEYSPPGSASGSGT
jgi:hypothetical protein